MRPVYGAPQSPGSRKVIRLADIPVYALALTIVLFAFVPALAETPFENPDLLFLMNTVFLSAVSGLVAGLALIGFLRSGRVEPLLVGCGVLFSGLGALIAGLIAGGERSPNDFVTVHNLGVFLAAAMHLAAASFTARHTSAVAPASLRVAVGVYGATVGLMLLVLAAERADVLPAFYIVGEGSTRVRELALTAAITLMSTAAGVLGLEARRLSGVSLRLYSRGLVLTAVGLAGAFLGSPGSLLSWAGRAAQYAGNLYLLAAVLIFIQLARRQQIGLRLAVAEFFRESAGHYRSLVETMQAAVVSMDPSEKVFLWNPAAEQMFGYSVEEALGRRFPELVATAEERAALRNVLASEGQSPVEMSLRRKDGNAVVAEISVVSAGKADTSLIVRDITELKRSEQAAREHMRQKEFLAEMVELASQPFAVGYPDGRVGMFNQAFERLTGYPADDLRGVDWHTALTPPEWRAGEQQKLDELRRTGRAVTYQKEYIRKDGTRVPVELLVGAALDPGGGVQYYYAFITDITRRKQAEAAIQQNLNSLELLAQIATELLQTADPRGIVASLCSRAMDHLSCDVFFNYLVDGQADRLRLNACGGMAGMEKGLELLDFGTALCACARDGKPFVPDPTLPSADPCRRVVVAQGIQAFACHPLLGTGGRVIGCLAFGSRGRETFKEAELLLMQGICDRVATALVRQRDEQALRASQLALERANEDLGRRVAERTGTLERTVHALKLEVEERQKTAAMLQLANQQVTDHARQLRALTGELTLVQHRERRRIGKVLHDNLQQLLSSVKLQVSGLPRQPEVSPAEAQRVVALVDEAIEVTRSLTGDLSPPILQVAGLKAGLEWLARRMAERLQIDVTVRAADDPPLPEEMKILVFETVRELLFNCAKHSGVQRAEVSIALTDGTLCVTVSDEGVGFDPLKHAKPGKMGTGFGLFGVRERLQLVGGALEIASAPGAGCRFHLRVPLGMGDGTGDVHPFPGPSAPRIRVLLVDDHAVVRQGLSMMLSKEPDIEVVGEAQDGWQALELAKRLAPDVVLMDISMPGLNGIEATRIICAELPDTRVLGLSMLYEEGESSEAFRAAGAVGFVSKGAPSGDLLAALRDCMSRPAAKPWPAASREEAQA